MQIAGQSLFLNIWLDKARNKFWLIPALTVTALIGLLMATLQLPNIKSPGVVGEVLLKDYSVESARLILSSIATAVMTVIGVLFSITVVTLQQVSEQYSPRVIESFIRSYSSQLMLGLYVGTFVYCILLLRQLPGASGQSTGELPQFALTVAVGLSLACIGFLIHYVHYISNSIKSTSIIESLRKDTIKHIQRYIGFLNKHGCDDSFYLKSNNESTKIVSAKAGYVQSCELEQIAEDCSSCQAHVRIYSRPGDFVQQGTLLAEVFSSATLPKKVEKKVFESIMVGSFRTHVQDYRFGLRQLVDIALKALSPAMNDPSTAIESLNSIEAILLEVIAHESPPQKISLCGVSFELNNVTEPELLGQAFNQIIANSKQHVDLLIRVRNILATLKSRPLSEDTAVKVDLLINHCGSYLKENDDSVLYASAMELSTGSGYQGSEARH